MSIVDNNNDHGFWPQRVSAGRQRDGGTLPPSYQSYNGYENSNHCSDKLQKHLKQNDPIKDYVYFTRVNHDKVDAISFWLVYSLNITLFQVEACVVLSRWDRRMLWSEPLIQISSLSLPHSCHQAYCIPGYGTLRKLRQLFILSALADSLGRN